MQLGYLGVLYHRWLRVAHKEERGKKALRTFKEPLLLERDRVSRASGH